MTPHSASTPQIRSRSRAGFGRVLRVYVRLAAASLQARLEYKINFAISTALYGLLSVVDMLLVAALLTRFRTVGGWNLYEVAILYGLSAAAMGLYRTFASELDNFERYTLAGEFDGLLIRPWPSLFVLLTRSVDVWRIGWALQGLLVATFGVLHVAGGGELTRLACLYIFVLPVSGGLIYFALGLACASLAFWVERIGEFQVFIVHAPQNAANYPMSVYPGWLRLLFSSAIPVAFVNYVPVRYLLGKGGGPVDLLLPPLVGIAAVCAAYRVWRWGERQYHSTGS